MIYIIVLFFTFLFSYSFDFALGKYKAEAKKYYVIIGVVIALIAGLRFYVGADTANYVQDFKITQAIDDLDFRKINDYSRLRPGYYLLVSFSKYICSNFLLLQLIVACISNFIILRFLWKMSSYPFACLLFYFAINYFEYNFEIMREVVAVSFGLLAFENFKKKKYIWFLLYCFIANLMHASAVILVLIPFIYFIRYSRKLLYFIIVLALSIFSIYQIVPDLTFLADFIFGYGDYGDKYLGHEINTDININFYIVHFTRYLILPVFALLIVGKQYRFTGFVMVWILFGMLSIFSYAFYRFNNYFCPFIWMLYVEAFFVLSKKTIRSRKLALVICVIASFYIYQRSLFSKDEYHGGYYIYERYIPYDIVGPNQDYNHNKSQYVIRQG